MLPYVPTHLLLTTVARPRMLLHQVNVIKTKSMSHFYINFYTLDRACCMPTGKLNLFSTTRWCTCTFVAYVKLTTRVVPTFQKYTEEVLAHLVEWTMRYVLLGRWRNHSLQSKERERVERWIGLEVMWLLLRLFDMPRCGVPTHIRMCPRFTRDEHDESRAFPWVCIFIC